MKKMSELDEIYGCDNPHKNLSKKNIVLVWQNKELVGSHFLILLIVLMTC